jgi:hypothetical protein
MTPTVLCSPCGMPGSVTDRAHASRRLSARTAAMRGSRNLDRPSGGAQNGFLCALVISGEYAVKFSISNTCCQVMQDLGMVCGPLRDFGLGR